MYSNQRLSRTLTQFYETYIEYQPVAFDNVREELNEICDDLFNMKLSYTNETNMLLILDNATKILRHFMKTDIKIPLDFIDYEIFLKITTVVVSLKNTLLNDDFETLNSEFMHTHFEHAIEQHLIDTYKSKIEVFKEKNTAIELQSIKELFTTYLLDYVDLTSKFIDKIPLETNIKLLLEVADLRILLRDFHKISHLISNIKKMPILQKMTHFCIKEGDIQDCGLLKSLNNDYKFEILGMSYFTLKNICKYLDVQNMHQTSDILSLLRIEDLIVLNELDEYNSSLLKFYEESIKLLTFKVYKNIINVPSHQIEKSITVLKLLIDPLHNGQITNCPFSVILLSMLYEFIIATDLHKDSITSLLDLTIDYLNMCKLPSNFLAVSYVFQIYKKLKTDADHKLKVIELCEYLSINMGLQDIEKDIETIMNSEEDCIDKSIILSRFLCFNGDKPVMKDKTLYSLYYALNENVILASQFTSMYVELVFPYSVSINFSIINKDDDCLFNNLAVLEDYIAIIIENETVPLEEKQEFLKIILKHYKAINHYLPHDFIINCFRCIFNPINMNIDNAKSLLNLCSSKHLSNLIDILKTETMEIIVKGKAGLNDDYCLYIHSIWTCLLNAQFMNTKKKIRKELVNHFCFILNKTFLFNKNKVATESGLMLLVMIVGSLLKLSWINKTMLMNCSLRIITFVEQNENINDVKLLTETAELLIVLYKCPNNSIKSLLGLYAITFVNFLKRCWSFTKALKTDDVDLYMYKRDLFGPFHKLEICSSLFKPNKSDFDIICRYIIEDIVDIIAMKNRLPESFMRLSYCIIFNLMDICSADEMKQLMLSIRGPSLLILRNAYRDYRAHIRFSGRL